jgi:hypothetical protein
MSEEWKAVVGFEGAYEVSSLGNVRSLKFGRKKNLSKSVASNYEIVCLAKDKKKFTKTVHRLMAMAFLPTVEGKSTVDHIDRNSFNNTLSNLRWADRTEQSINRDCYSNCNEKNISQSIVSGHYHVIIRRYKKVYHNTAHKTLEEAILARDASLLALELEPVL